MKKPIKLLFVVLGVGAVIALAFFGWSAKAKGNETFHLANGINITPIEIKPDETAELLDAKFWKFDVSWPHRKGHFRVGLSLYQRGKVDKFLVGGFGVETPASSHSELTVGIVPVTGTVYDSQQLKYRISTETGNGLSGTIENPFVHAHGYGPDEQVIEPQNLVLIMSGNLKKNYISSPGSLNERAIVLELTETMPSK